MGVGAAELGVVDGEARVVSDHRWTVDERIRRRGHHDKVGQPQEQRRPRDEGSVDDKHDRHNTRTTGNRLRCQPPPVQAGQPLGGVIAGGMQHTNQRMPIHSRGVGSGGNREAIVEAEIRIVGIDAKGHRQSLIVEAAA